MLIIYLPYRYLSLRCKISCLMDLIQMMSRLMDLIQIISVIYIWIDLKIFVHYCLKLGLNYYITSFMYSSFISTKSDTTQEANQKYIHSLEDQIKVRQSQRIQLISRLQRAETYFNQAKTQVIEKYQTSTQSVKEAKSETNYNENELEIQHLYEKQKQQYEKLKSDYENIKKQKDKLKQVNTEMISSLMFSHQAKQIEHLSQRLNKEQEQKKQLLNYCNTLQQQNKALKEQLQRKLYQKATSEQSNEQAQKLKEQMQKLKYKLDAQEKRMEYQRKQKQQVKQQLDNYVKLSQAQSQKNHIYNQSGQKSYKLKIQSLERRLQIQKNSFLQKIEEYQKIINISLLSSRQTANISKNTNKVQKKQPSSLSNLQYDHILIQYKQNIQSMQRQSQEENKRLNILEQSNHQLRKQLVHGLQKEENARKMLIQQRKRSKSKEYFLQKEKNLHISNKYLNRSRSKETNIHPAKLNENNQGNKVYNEKIQQNLSKIRKGIIGSLKSSDIQNKCKLSPTNKKNIMIPIKNISSRYDDISQKNCINNSVEETVNNSFQGLTESSNLMKNLCIKNSRNKVDCNGPFTQRIRMVKTNNEEDVSYSKYRISTESLQEQENLIQQKNKVTNLNSKLK